MLFTRVVSLLQAGDAGAARALLQAEPGENAHHAFLLGACCHAQGDIPAALSAFTESLRLEPAHTQAACALGSLYAGLGRRIEADALFRKTLALVEDPQLRFNLAVNLEDSQRPGDALREYDTILRLDPEHYAARHNRAGLLAREQRLGDAAEDYRMLARQHPDKTVVRHNLGEVELGLGHYEAAIAQLETVLQQEPGNSKALLSLAVAFAANGDIPHSRASFAALRHLDPARWEEARAQLNNRYGQDADVDPRLIFLLRQHDHLEACNWQHWDAFSSTLDDFIRAPGDTEAVRLAYLSMTAPLDAQQQLQLMSHIAGQIARSSPVFDHSATPAPGRLRIGYAATRFGHHVTGLLFRHFFAAHDPAVVELHLLSLGPDDGSENIRHLRRTPGLRWWDFSAISDEEAAQRIHALQLDVIIDLAVFNDSPRPEILARRPAPIQISWQGAAYSSGAPWIDYIISDPLVRPGKGWCSEAEVLWPDSFFVCSREARPPEVPSRQQLGLPEHKFVFSCLNTAVKIGPGIFDSWMRILKATPDSILWLLAGNTSQILNLKREAEWRGIDPRRLLFASRVSPEEHLARLGAADLFLDTPHFNGHTTIAESLWAGTPVLTCPGNTFASRVGASLLSACQLTELITADGAGYENLAIALYHDRARLDALRQQLARSRLHASTFDLQKQARRIEETCRQGRRIFAEGRAPQDIVIHD